MLAFFKAANRVAQAGGPKPLGTCESLRDSKQRRQYGRLLKSAGARTCRLLRVSLLQIHCLIVLMGDPNRPQTSTFTEQRGS